MSVNGPMARRMTAEGVLRSLGMSVAKRSAEGALNRASARRAIAVSQAARVANKQVRLTVSSSDDMVPTQDRSDRAHACRAEEEIRGPSGVVVPKGFLLPAGMVNEGRSRPREYPRSQTVAPVQYVASGDGVRRRVERVMGLDSMFDRLHQVQRRLEREFGEDAGSSHETLAAARDRAMGQIQARNKGVANTVNRNRDAYTVKSAEDVIADFHNGTWKAEDA